MSDLFPLGRQVYQRGGGGGPNKSAYEAYAAGLVGLALALGLEAGVESIRVVLLAQDFGFFRLRRNRRGSGCPGNLALRESAGRTKRVTWYWRVGQPNSPS